MTTPPLLGKLCQKSALAVAAFEEPGMLTTFLAYVVIAAFFLTESRARQGEQAHSLEREAFDRRSTLAVAAGMVITVIGLVAAPLLSAFQIASLYAFPLIGWIGLAAAASGVALRLWANRTLGAFYTRTLRVAEDQRIVQEGPYRLIRHPGYLGSIMLWVGAALASLNGVALAIAALIMIPVYVYRIQVEEAMFAATSGEAYRDYQTRTRKLIPFIF